jgi:ketosteroid isomerase-like protein
MTPREVFLRLVHGVADGRYDELPALYAEETDVRHPMTPYGARPLLTRDALRQHFGSGGRAPTADELRFGVDNVVIHETRDPEVIVAEFAYVGESAATGALASVPCIFVLRIRDGQIVESRDYVDHVAMARARGRLDELIAAIR